MPHDDKSAWPDTANLSKYTGCSSAASAHAAQHDLPLLHCPGQGGCCILVGPPCYDRTRLTQVTLDTLERGVDTPRPRSTPNFDKLTDGSTNPSSCTHPTGRIPMANGCQLNNVHWNVLTKPMQPTHPNPGVQEKSNNTTCRCTRTSVNRLQPCLVPPCCRLLCPLLQLLLSDQPCQAFPMKQLVHRCSNSQLWNTHSLRRLEGWLRPCCLMLLSTTSLRAWPASLLMSNCTTDKLHMAETLSLFASDMGRRARLRQLGCSMRSARCRSCPIKCSSWYCSWAHAAAACFSSVSLHCDSQTGDATTAADMNSSPFSCSSPQRPHGIGDGLRCPARQPRDVHRRQNLPSILLCCSCGEQWCWSYTHAAETKQHVGNILVCSLCGDCCQQLRSQKSPEIWL